MVGVAVLAGFLGFFVGWAWRAVQGVHGWALVGALFEALQHMPEPAWWAVVPVILIAGLGAWMAMSGER